MDFASPAFWTALGSIVLANILLSGDNAVVIAMAARGLPARQQRRAVVFGSGAAVVMRIVLTLLAVRLLTLPGLKLAGGVLLLWIGVKLLLEDDRVRDAAGAPPGIGAAVRTILLADLVMSLDNVLAVAAAAQGDNLLLMLGLAISVPLIVFGSALLLEVMERWPFIITAGAALLGWLAGTMMLEDPLVERSFEPVPAPWVHAAGGVGALLVVATGTWLQRRAATRSQA